MNVPFYIARRYLISKKSTNAVNLIAAISILGVAVGTAAMIAVMSGFNGLENLIRSFYNTFDPDFKITAVQGKYMEKDSTYFMPILDVDGVEAMSFILEDKALLKFRDKEFIATIKGVDQNYAVVTNFTESIRNGNYFGKMTDEVGVLGVGVAYHLNLARLDFVDPLQLYVPKPDYKVGLDPMQSVAMRHLYPIGTFSVQPDYDVKYVVTPLAFARDLFERPQGITSIEVAVDPLADQERVKSEVAQLLGTEFDVLDRNEQQKTIFRVMKIEGLATFLILAFILTIASFGIIGTLIMLILEKKEDINTLRSMGAPAPLIKRIFFLEGLLISTIGCVAGIGLGIVLVLLQDKFGFLAIGQGYAMDAYPVDLRIGDLIRVLITIMAIGSVISWVSVRKLKTDF